MDACHFPRLLHGDLSLPFPTSCVPGPPPGRECEPTCSCTCHVPASILGGTGCPVHTSVRSQSYHITAWACMFVCRPHPSDATCQPSCTCSSASHVLVQPRGAWAHLFTHLPFPRNTRCHEHIYLHVCCVSAMSPKGAGMSAYMPSLPRTATCWPKHACSCISCVPALIYCDPKSSVHVIDIAAECQQCHVALQTHLFMPAMPQCHHTVVWKCLGMPSRSQGCRSAA